MSRNSTPTGLRRAAPWLALAGLGALWIASEALNARAATRGAWAALAAGLAAWLVAARLDPPEADRLGELDARAGRPRWIPLVLALAAAGVAVWRMPPEQFRRDGVAAWLAAVGLWLAAWWPRRRTSREERRSAGRLVAVGGVLALWLVVGGWFLYHDLARVPPNPVSDHAEEMLDLNDLLHGQTGIYFFRNLGIPPFPHYWDAAFLRITGRPLRFLWVKAATATFGLLLIPALYLLGSELAGPPLGLAAAAFGAWGKWPVSLARQGQGYIFAIPFAGIVLWACLLWLRRGDRRAMLAAGVALGLGMATYTSFRVVPLLVPLAVAMALLDRRRRGRRWAAIGEGLLASATALLVFLPVLKFALVGEHREFFWSRVLTRATDVEHSIQGSRLAIFAGNLWNMAKAFHWQGASTWNVLAMYEPFLDPVAGACLLAGALLALLAALRGNWRWTWLLVALFVLTLPSTLVFAYPDENPSLNRAGVAIPAVFVLAGLPFAFLWQGWRREGRAWRAVGLAACAVAMAASIRANREAYFVRLGNSYDSLIEHSMEVAAALRDYQKKGVPLAQEYLLGTDFWIDARNVALDLGDPAWVDAHNVPPPQVPELAERPLVFVYRPNELARLEALHRLYPTGTERLYPQSNPDRNFGVYYVP